MAQGTIPTKGNLLNVKKSLALSKLGYELLDRKRNILIREMMALIDRASEIQSVIDESFKNAYQALQNANITLGFCDEISKTIPVETGVHLDFRSIMGVEIPIATIDPQNANMLCYGLQNTNSRLDDATAQFMKVKELTVELAQIENSVYRLAIAIKKTQKRANALKNIMIPKFEEDVKFITDALDEKDREEFSRLKVIKKQKQE
ncbi:MAG: V-type ATP synthase subunit D [Ruminococcus sp.]|nr:V-type ATP synthase subunit D [Ruminococcus sp.]